MNLLSRLEPWLLLFYAASLPLSMTASWVLYIAGIICTLLVTARDRSVLSVFRAPLAVPLIALLAVVFISGSVNGGLGEGFASLWSLKALGVYPWAYLVFSRHVDVIYRSAAALLSVSAVAGVYGTIQQVFDVHLGQQYLQGTGFLAGPMAFAGQMQLFSLLAAGLLIGRGYGHLPGVLKHPALFTVITIANCLGAFFASERSAWLGFAAGILAVCALISWKLLVAALGGMGLLGAAAWFTVPVVQTRLVPLLTDWRSDVSVTARIFLWTQSLELWKKSPLFGIGIRRFPSFHIPEATQLEDSHNLIHAHSNIVHLATTIGIAGLLAYLWLNVQALIFAARRFAEKTDLSPIFLGVFGGTVALLVAGLFEYNFGTSQVRLAQWLLLAMLIKPDHSERS